MQQLPDVPASFQELVKGTNAQGGGEFDVTLKVTPIGEANEFGKIPAPLVEFEVK